MAAAGFTWTDVGSVRLPIEQFAAFVVHSPPGTAVHHERHEGWSVTDHLLAQAIDALNLLVWTKTTDARRRQPRHKPEPIPRPGQQTGDNKSQAQAPQQQQVMTVAEYAKRAGLDIDFGEE